MVQGIMVGPEDCPNPALLLRFLSGVPISVRGALYARFTPRQYRPFPSHVLNVVLMLVFLISPLNRT